MHVQTAQCSVLYMSLLSAAFGSLARYLSDAADSLSRTGGQAAKHSLLLAAGAMEAAFTVLTLRDNVAPHTLNLEKPIPGPWEDALIRQRPRKLPLQQKMAMSNSFGFGGVNASLLFASPPMYEDPIVDGTP